MIVFTPKSMLRHKKAVSAVEDLIGETAFQPVLPDNDVDASKVDRALLCSGKIVWDLRAERAKRADEHTAILPVEQLYPLATEYVRTQLSRFQVARGAVGPGRTAEHGAVAVHGAAPAAETWGRLHRRHPPRGGRSVMRVALAARRSTA